VNEGMSTFGNTNNNSGGGDCFQYTITTALTVNYTKLQKKLTL